MADSKPAAKGTYPLQPFPFDTAHSVPSANSSPATPNGHSAGYNRGAGNSSRHESAYPSQTSTNEPSRQSNGHLSRQPQGSLRRINGFDGTAERPQHQSPPGSYPLQTLPARTPQARVVSMPEPQKANARNPHTAGLRPKGSIRRMSLSYPLQARPSQIFRDDTNLPARPQANGTSSVGARKPDSSMSMSSSERKTSYPLQVMPPPRSSPAVSPMDRSPESRTSVSTTSRTEHPTSGLQQAFPFQGMPVASPAASNAPSVKYGQAAEEDARRWRSTPTQGPPAPAVVSGGTAISSGRDSQASVLRRRPYQASAAPPDLSQSARPAEVALENSGATTSAASTWNELANGLPRLPRNIRALKDGQNGKIPGRTIVICLDGTGDKFDADNSNIVHLVSCLKKSDRSQLTYYQSGIGTYDGGGLSNGVNAALDMAIGSGLGVHIRDAYHFLMQNYSENDRICIFGFSRGAYTARCLAGMVHKVGLLPRHNTQQLPFAYEYYKDDTQIGWDMSAEFKRTFCVDVSVHFIGCFDSVASVGFIPRTLPLSSTPWNKATYFRHALALDEHRAKFKAKQFEMKDSTDPNARWETVAESKENGAVRTISKDTGSSSKPKPDVFETADDGCAIEADLYARQKRQEGLSKQTDVLEVWFAGAHADVGGGAEKNVVRHKLAQIPLRWMLRQCFECDTGIIFKVHRLAEEGLDVHTLWPKYTSLGVPRMGPSPSLIEKYNEGKIAPISRRASVLKPVDHNDPEGPHDVALWKDEDKRHLHEDWVPEHVEDYFDSISRVNDQLVGATAWWILEFWPIKVRVQLRDSEEWAKKISFNLGRYRAVQDRRPNLHWTVQQRIDAMGYRIHARMARNADWNIVA